MRCFIASVVGGWLVSVWLGGKTVRLVWWCKAVVGLRACLLTASHSQNYLDMHGVGVCLAVPALPLLIVIGSRASMKYRAGTVVGRMR